MKTQEIFSTVVTENEYVKDAETHAIISTRKRVILTNNALPAFGKESAAVQAILAAGRVTGDNAIKDEAEVEVRVTRPFCE